MKLISDWHLGNIINCKYFHFLHIKSDQTKREDRSRFEAIITRNRINYEETLLHLFMKERKKKLIQRIFENYKSSNNPIPNQDSSWLTKPKFKTIHSNDRSSSSWSDFDAAKRRNFTRRGNGGCIDKQGSTERWLRTFDRCLPLLQPIVANISEGDRGCLRNNWRVVILSSK